MQWKILRTELPCCYNSGVHSGDVTAGENRALLAPSPWLGDPCHCMSYSGGPCRREGVGGGGGGDGGPDPAASPLPGCGG